MNTCITVAMDALDESVQKILGDFIFKNSLICLNCRGLNFLLRYFYPQSLHVLSKLKRCLCCIVVALSLTHQGCSRLLCDTCVTLKESQPSPVRIDEASNPCSSSALTLRCLVCFVK